MSSSSLIRTIVEDEIAERSTFRLDCDLVDLDGEAISSVTTLTLKILTVGGTVIRDVGDISDSFSAGHVSWESAIDDAKIVGSGPKETHVALLEWTWDSGAKAGRHEVWHTVADFRGVSSS